MITPQELLLKVIDDLEKTEPNVKVNSLHMEMLNECCSVAIDSNPNAHEEMLIFAAQVAFATSLNQLKNIQQAIKVKYGDDTIVNFNYKDNEFQILNNHN